MGLSFRLSPLCFVCRESIHIHDSKWPRAELRNGRTALVRGQAHRFVVYSLVNNGAFLPSLSSPAAALFHCAPHTSAMRFS